MIATTSKLLSTGADCKMTKLIVLDEMIGSMTEFKQIIGRGTRLREKEGKTHFVVMDFRNVTRLVCRSGMGRPHRNGTRASRQAASLPPGTHDQPVQLRQPGPAEPRAAQTQAHRGCERGCTCSRSFIKTVSIYDANGKLLRQESIVDYTKENIRGEYASLDNFIRQWSAQEKKEQIRDLLRERGIDLEHAQGRSEDERCGRLRLHLPCGLRSKAAHPPGARQQREKA